MSNQSDSTHVQQQEQTLDHAEDVQHMYDLAEDLRTSVATQPLADGGILTSANHRTWFPNIHPKNWVHKVFKSYRYGNYVVADRKTGETIWEDMPVYVRIGMHLMFASAFDHRLLETHKLQHLFLEESVKQGRHFDAPESVAQIPHFIKTYNLKLSELLEPDVTKYGCFNEFFYRKLRADARPIDQKENPNVITAAADCRLSCFDSISSATELWIKGKAFTVQNLLQDEALASQYQDGGIALFRLAPQDYHRFHSPVQGTVSRDPVKIGGTYFTVNPMAVQEKLDVFTENVRVVTVMDLDQQVQQQADGQSSLNSLFNQCVFVSVGALLVGSIELTGAKQTGNKIQKGDELGYFAYGGSTCILLFKKGAVQFDQDLLENSRKGMETLVYMGEHIGVCL
ncbi:hypothetical protein EDD11_000012 [Mortierella claussenii]|nr:hypothetical protein EDD11_000012 [Mortierella claussenii]